MSARSTAREPTEHTIGDTDRTLRRHACSAVPVGLRAFAERYHAACQLYFDEIARAEHATIVIWYDDFARPSLLRFSLMIGNWLAVSCQHGAHGD
jgi:hypothetical protein